MLPFASARTHSILTSLAIGGLSDWELTIPSELAYGESQRGPHITPGAVLVFELQLLKVMGPSSHEL